MKINKIISALLCAILVFSTVGCSATQAGSIPAKNHKLTQVQVLQNLAKKTQKIQSVRADYKITVTQLDKNKKPDPKGTSANYDITTKTIYKGVDKDKFPAISQMYDKSVNIINGKKETTASYVNLLTKKAYYDADGKGLKEYKGTQLKTETESNYVPVVKFMLLSKSAPDLVKTPEKQLKMTEEKEYYVFNYKGKGNGALLYKLDGLFGLAVDQMGLDDIQMDLTYKVSKKDFTLSYVKHVLDQQVTTNNNQKVNYISKGEYIVTGIDDIKQITEAKDLK